jgi:hypothetical protein
MAKTIALCSRIHGSSRINSHTDMIRPGRNSHGSSASLIFPNHGQIQTPSTSL